MSAASARLVGVTEPIFSGLTAQVLKKRTSSSIRSASDTPGFDITASLSGLLRGPRRIYLSGAIYFSLRVSKKSFTREKNPVDSGLFSSLEARSNSSRSSRCRRDRFRGVSTTIWTYMSPT